MATQSLIETERKGKIYFSKVYCGEIHWGLRDLIISWRTHHLPLEIYWTTDGRKCQPALEKCFLPMFLSESIRALVGHSHPVSQAEQLTLHVLCKWQLCVLVTSWDKQRNQSGAEVNISNTELFSPFSDTSLIRTIWSSPSALQSKRKGSELGKWF